MEVIKKICLSCQFNLPCIWMQYLFYFDNSLFVASSQQYFSLTSNQHQSAATSQPAVLFSYNKSAPATSHSTANRVNICYFTQKYKSIFT